MDEVLGLEKVDLPGTSDSDGLARYSEFWCASFLSVQYCNNQICKGASTLVCREVIKKDPPDG